MWTDIFDGQKVKRDTNEIYFCTLVDNGINDIIKLDPSLP